jgi:hypothetical protein
LAGAGTTFTKVFDHAGLQLWARCSNAAASTGTLLLRAFNTNTGGHNAVIKSTYQLGGSAFMTTDSNAAAGNPMTTAYSSTVAGSTTGPQGYVEDDQFTPNENWDFNPTSTGGMSDAVGKLVFTDDAGNVVALEYLAHQKQGDEDPFISGTNTGCVFAGQALFNPA